MSHSPAEKESISEKGGLPTLEMQASVDGNSSTHGDAPAMPQPSGRGAVNAFLLYSVIVVAMSGCLFGVENSLIGPVAGMKSFVARYQGLNKVGELTLSSRNQSLVFSVPLVGTIFGALAATPLQNRFGRKWTLFGAYLFSLPAVFLQFFAPNLGAFIAGRFMNALDYGVATAVAPTFLADLVVPSMRGRSVSLNNLLTITASVIAVIICWASESTHRESQWAYRIPLAVQVGLPFGLLALTAWISESPVWLIQKGRIDEARQVLRKIRSYSDEAVESELLVMKAAEDAKAALDGDVKFWEIFQGKNLKRTLIAGSFFSLNQISGIILSTTYATLFLADLGAGDPFVLSVVAAVCQLVGALAAPFCLDMIGRRKLALCGFAALLAIDVSAGTLAFFPENRNAVTAVAALSFIFNFTWTISFYAISLLLPAELPTARLRNATMSYAVGWGQTTAVITTFAVPQIVSSDAANLGAKTYLVFAGCMACILVYGFWAIPETRGRSLAEIDEMYEKNVPARHWSRFVCETAAKEGASVSALKEEARAVAHMH